LHCIDQNWTKHIDAMARLREGIHLRSYANVNPLQDYVNEGYSMFNETLELASVDAVLNLVNIDKFVKQVEDAEAARQAQLEAQKAAEEAAKKEAGPEIDLTKKEENK